MKVTSQEVINIVSNHARNEEVGNISEHTRLVGDLGLSSVDFVVIFEELVGLMNTRMNFIDLIMPTRSSYVDDLTVEQIVNFVNQGETTKNTEPGDDPYKERREPIRQEDVDNLRESVQHQTYKKEEVENSSRFCFVLSAPRSGSTLLQRMLGCHPEIYAPMELHLMGYQDFAQRAEELKSSRHAHLLEGTIVAREETRAMTRAVSEAVESMYVKDKRSVVQFYSEISSHSNSKILVDKTPSYAFSLSTLLRIKDTFPNAKFIHLRRRANASIKSLIDSELIEIIRFCKTSGIGERKLAEALWCLCEQNILSLLEYTGDRTIRVEYESLVKKPIETMQRVHLFLGVNPSEDIDPYANTNQSRIDVGNYAGDLKNYLRSFIDERASSEWERFDSLSWLSEPSQMIMKNN